MKYFKYSNEHGRRLVDQDGNRVTVHAGEISGILSTNQFSDPARNVFSKDVQLLSVSAAFRDSENHIRRYTGVFSESDLLTSDSIIQVDRNEKFKDQSRVMNKHCVGSLPGQARELLGQQEPDDMFTIWISEHEDHLILRVGVSADERQMSSYHGMDKVYDFKVDLGDLLWRSDYTVVDSEIVLGSAPHVYLVKGQDLGSKSHDFPVSPIDVNQCLSQ